jgi:hypothetical protein
MQPGCNLLAVAVSDHLSPDNPPSRPILDPPPRAMAGRGDQQSGALSAACPARPSTAASVGRRSDISGVIGVNANGPSDARYCVRAHR